MKRYVKTIASMVNNTLSSAIPEGTTKPDHMRSVRSCNLVSLLIVAVSVPYTLQYQMLGLPWMSVAVIVAAVGGVGNLLLLRRTHAPTLSAHITVLILFGMLMLSNSVSGGFYDPDLSWLYVVPVLAGFLIGRRALWIYGALTTFAIAVFFMLDQVGIAVPDLIPPEQHAVQSLIHRLSSTACITVLIYGFLFERDRAEKELLTATLEAKAAANSTSSFLARMSHEIRTPLNAVIGMSELLLDSELDARQRDCMTTVCSAGGQLVQLVNDVLDFSKMGAGQLALVDAPFDPRAELEAIVDILGTTASSKGLLCTWIAEPSVPHIVLGDAMRLRQVLTNLLGNAIKFTPRGEVVLRVAVADDPKDPRGRSCVRLEFSVVDTGIGMTAESQARIFEPFTQAMTTTSREFGGTGLGLAISRDIIELMGGTLRVTSRLGEGSRFFFVLPLGLVNDDVSDSQTSRASLGPLLIVGEHPLLCENLASQATRLGVRADTAASPSEAHARLAERTYHAVLIDERWRGALAPLAASLEAKDASATRIILALPFGETLAASETLDRNVETISKPITLARLRDGLATARTGGERARGAQPQAPTGAAAQMLLVVEDNPINQKLMRFQLSKLGYDFEIVDDGAQAVDAVKNGRYDAVLMDCEMPRMNGYTSTRMIRDLGHADLPIIGITAHNLSGDRDKCIDAGMSDYVTKPLRIAELARALERHIPKPRSA